MSNFSMARLRPLNMPLLRAAETHGRRLDATAIKRKVRDEPSLTWVPDGVEGDPLALPDRLADHVAGALVPAGKTKAQHMLVKLPASVPVETREQAQAALELIVQFAQDTFGGAAVFSARMDRDERSLNSVDVFLAPRYEKVTKRDSKQAVSMTRFTKMLVEKHAIVIEQDSARGSMSAQGKALQTELAQWLTGKGYEAARGKPKTAPGDDWVSPEIAGMRIELEKDRTKFQDWATAEAIAIVEKSAAASSMLDAARIEATQIIADAKKAAEAEAARILQETKAEAERNAKAVVEDREAALASATAAFALERKALDVEQAVTDAKSRRLDTQSSRLAALIAELEPVVTGFRNLPAMVKQAIDQDGVVGRMADAAGRLIDRGRVALTRGPTKTSVPATAPVPIDDEIDAATLLAAAAKTNGRG